MMLGGVKSMLFLIYYLVSTLNWCKRNWRQLPFDFYFFFFRVIRKLIFLLLRNSCFIRKSIKLAPAFSEFCNEFHWQWKTIMASYGELKFELMEPFVRSIILAMTLDSSTNQDIFDPWLCISEPSHHFHRPSTLPWSKKLLTGGKHKEKWWLSICGGSNALQSTLKRWLKKQKTIQVMFIWTDRLFRPSWQGRCRLKVLNLFGQGIN